MRLRVHPEPALLRRQSQQAVAPPSKPGTPPTPILLAVGHRTIGVQLQAVDRAAAEDFVSRGHLQLKTRAELEGDIGRLQPAEAGDRNAARGCTIPASRLGWC